MTTVALLHPGRMGVTLGAAFAQHAGVGWCSSGRSDASRARAITAGLEEFSDLSQLLAWAEIVVSIIPPAASGELVETVLASGFGGTLVDANAISPATARANARRCEDAGAHYVDGGVMGRPPTTAGTTTLYLSGPRAPRIAALLDGSPFGAIVLGEAPDMASAMKCAYSSYLKASRALLLTARSLARAHGIEEALLDEWSRTQPRLRDETDDDMPRMMNGAWRFDAEMREIATAMEEQGLPTGFHDAAAIVYERLAGIEDGTPGQIVERFVDAVRPDDWTAP